MKKPLIPFKLLPAAWGLKGKTFEKAKAEYELAGDDLAIKLAEIEHGPESDQIKLATLNASKNQGAINQGEYEKQLATLKKEPWVSVVNIKVNKTNPNSLGEVELDWNEAFVEMLKKHGYNGVTDYSIVDSWFTMVCAAVANDTGIRLNQNDEPDDDKLAPGLREYK